MLAHTDAADVRPGDVVMLRCDLVMANDVSGPVAFRALERMGVERVFDRRPRGDGRGPLHAREGLALGRAAEAPQGLVGRAGRDLLRPGPRRDRAHALCEEGWIVPGSVIAGGDSHTWARTAPSARSGAAGVDGRRLPRPRRVWQAVPATIRVTYTGEKGHYVTGSDLILAVLAEIGVGGGTNAVLEFVGDGAEALTIDERLAVANMAVEAGPRRASSRRTTRSAPTSTGAPTGSGAASGPTPTQRRYEEHDRPASLPLVALPPPAGQRRRSTTRSARGSTRSTSELRTAR